MTDRLDLAVLARLRGSDVRTPAYDVTKLVPTVVHIGPGVFHRGHQAVYADTILSTGAAAGGICAVSLRSADVRDSLRDQDQLYSVVEREEGRHDVRIIGSIRTALVAREEPDAVLRAMADPAVTVVTITVTEKGYCAVPATGALDLGRAEVAHDIAAPTSPQSLPGYLVEALARRRAAGVAPFTVVSCDNLRANGAATRRVVTELAATRGGDLAEWIAGTVAFPSSMVDRMVPATTDDVRTELRERFGYADEAAVATERFSQWVLEDTFPGGRPAWELAGVEMVADVAPFEQAKLRILNGAHSAFAYLGLLAGYAAMADAARDPRLRAAVVAMLDAEVIPTLRAPDGLDLTAYAARTVDRFSNRALGYLTAKVAADGSQKLPVRILGTVRDRMAAGAGIEGLAAVVAAFIACVLGPRSPVIRVDDPALDLLLPDRAPEADAAVAVDRVVSVPQIFGELATDRAFRDVVTRHAAALWTADPRLVLQPRDDRGWST